MKKRLSSHVALIELAGALLVFMLASVTILGLFTTAYARSEASGKLTDAVILAQDYAAQIAAADDAFLTLENMGFSAVEGGYMRNDADGLTVSIELEYEQTEVGTLLNAMITVFDAQEQVFAMPVSRYYNKEVIHP